MTKKIAKRVKKLGKKVGKKVKKHPKIAASIIFFLLMGIVSFILGYKQDVEKTDKNGNKYPVSHHFWNGLKWLVIIYVIFVIIVLLIVFMFQADFVTIFLFGGNVIGSLLQLIGSLLTDLGK